MQKMMWIIFALVLTPVFCESNGDAEDATVETANDNIDVNIPGMDGKLPSPAELLKMLDSMDLSEEEKDNIRDSILKNSENMDNVTGSSGGGGFLQQALILLSLLSLLALIFGFFGWKLYKSLVEKEIKREMKRKQKELKKKK